MAPAEVPSNGPSGGGRSAVLGHRDPGSRGRAGLFEGEGFQQFDHRPEEDHEADDAVGQNEFFLKPLGESVAVQAHIEHIHMKP